MLYALNRVPSQFNRANFLIRTKEVSPERGNDIEGMVRPGALRFSQQCVTGDYTHETTSGVGVIDIEGTEVEAPVGRPVVVPGGKRFTYINKLDKDWTFRAKLPFWSTPTFNYSVGSTHYSGADVWFELKRSPDSYTNDPMYRLTPVAPGMNAAVVAVEPRSETIAMRAPAHHQVITPIVGEGILSVGAGAPGRLALDRPIRVLPGELHKIVNTGTTTALFQMWPDPPRVWTPRTYEWEFSPGEFVNGSAVWFQFVFSR